MPDIPVDPCGGNDPRTELPRLAALRAFSIMDTPAEIEFDRLVKLAAQLCDTPMAAISMIDEHRLWFKASYGLTMTEMDLSIAFCTQGIRQSGFYQVPDALRDPQYRNNPLVTGGPMLRFYAGYPLRTQGGQVLGMLAVLDRQPRALTPKQREQLETLSVQAMITLELRRRQLLLQEIVGEQKRGRAVRQQLGADVARLGYWQLDSPPSEFDWSDEALAVLGRAPGRTLTMTELLSLIDPGCRDDWRAALAACFASAIPMDHECPVLSDGREINLRWLASPQLDEHDGSVRKLIGVVQDVSEFREVERAAHRWHERYRLVATLTSDAVWEWDIGNDVIWWGERMRQLLGPHTGICHQRDALRLVHPDDRARVQHELDDTLADTGQRQWSANFRMLRIDRSSVWIEDHAHIVRDHAGKALRMVGCLKDVSAQIEYEARRQADERRIHQLAFYDPLTRLPNRIALLDRLQHALSSSRRHGEHGALMFLDLDNFKTLNDTQGHDIGDRLLQQVAQRLQACVRGEDTVARLGGDEFVVLLEELGDDAGYAALQAESAAKKLLAAFRQPFNLGTVLHSCTTSVGVTLFDGVPDSVDELLKQADLAMYESKQAGRDSVHFFDPRMQELVMQRATLEADLRRALQRQEFVLHYQPQWLRDGRLAGLEALLRWQHPQNGLVYPDDFIGVCEESGLILPIGRWVLRSACEQLATWHRAGLRDTRISVNVSPRQLRSPDFVDEVRSALQASNAPPSCLKLELTESMLLRDVEASIEKMRDLRSIGVRFALDDFGTGYSSLSLLQRLPLDQIKIDQSFVHGLGKPGNDSAVVQSIISLGKNLHMAVIAEGIETTEQRDLLASFGCDEFQGFLHGRSMPAEDAVHLVESL